MVHGLKMIDKCGTPQQTTNHAAVNSCPSNNVWSWSAINPWATGQPRWHCQLVNYMTAMNTSLSLSLSFNGHFPDGSGLAGTRTSPLWILLQLRLMEVVVITGAKLKDVQSSSDRHQQQTNNQFFTGRMPFLSHPINIVKALKGNSQEYLQYLNPSFNTYNSFSISSIGHICSLDFCLTGPFFNIPTSMLSPHKSP